MTNYEKIIHETSVEQLAEKMIHKVIEFDGINDDPYVGYKTTKSNTIYTDYSEALNAEIEWLKEEVES